ncbi:MAG: hypothetical protein RPR97_07030 [Colwellia sp.]
MKFIDNVKASFFGKKNEDNSNELAQQIPENIDMKNNKTELIKKIESTVKQLQNNTARQQGKHLLKTDLIDFLDTVFEVLQSNPEEIDNDELSKQTAIIESLSNNKELYKKAGANKLKIKVENINSLILEQSSKALHKPESIKPESIKVEPIKVEPIKAEPINTVQKDRQTSSSYKPHTPVPKQKKHEPKVSNTGKDDSTSIISELKDSIAKGMRDVSNKVESIKNFISQDIRALDQKLERNVRTTVDVSNKLQNELQNISISITKDILKKEDFSFELGQQFKKLDSLKDVSEDLESLPANYKSIKSELASINDKLDNVSTSSVKKSSVKVPKHEKAVADLATYMRDGVEQLENMSRLYVETIADIESIEIERAQHTEQLSKSKDEGIKEGIQRGEGLLAKKIAEQFPTEFEEIKSIFSSVISFEYAVGQAIEVTNENKNGLMPYFSTELELGEYQVISSDILIAGDIVVKAKVEKVAQSTKEV